MTSNKKSLLWTLFWIVSALIFNVGIYFIYGQNKAIEFLSGYLVEESLSVDNLFAFLLIFSYFSVPLKNQHRVLFWGILCAFILRGIFIFAGVVLIECFHWLLYILGGILVVTSIKMLLVKENKDVEKNYILRVLRRFLPITKYYDGNSFVIKKDGKWMGTPLLIVLLMIEVSDFIFAMDSLPAIFSITLDPFIIYTSNIFAILGLRSMFFILAGVMGLFRYLKYGLSVILAFVGTKMLLSDIYKIPIMVTLIVIATILVMSILLSIRKTKAEKML